MAKCGDKSVQTLNNKGYNVVKLPRAGIEPMDILGKDSKATEWLGPLADVWSTTVALPTPSTVPSMEISGQQSNSLDLSVGLKMLGNVLQAFGASTPSLDAAYKKAKTLTFTYGKVTSTSVRPMQAGNFLAGGTLNSANPVVKHYMLEDDAEAYLIFDVLKSNEISVVATDQHGAEVKVDLGVIQSMVGANVGLAASGSGGTKLTYSGSVPVTFAFRAFEISFDQGAWRLQGAGADTGLSFAAAVGGGAEPVGDPILLRNNGLLSIK
jgi:hypothetical protein